MGMNFPMGRRVVSHPVATIATSMDDEGGQRPTRRAMT